MSLVLEYEVSANTQVKIPLDAHNDTDNNYSIDWGEPVSDTTALTHTYTTSGTKTISISGKISSLNYYTYNPVNASKLTKCIQFGDVDLKKINFGRCSVLLFVPDTLPTSITDVSYMFYAALIFDQNLSSWDMSHVENMSFMFAGVSANTVIYNNNDAPLEWGAIGSTSGVTLSNMFKYSKFNQNISSWDTTNVSSMINMFYYSAFNNGGVALTWNYPIGNTLNVSLSSMFEHAQLFNQTITWNTENVTSMNNLFCSATAFNNGATNEFIPLIWNTENVVYMSNMFDHASSFNQDISSWNVSNVNTFRYMFYYATKFNNGGNSFDWDEIGIDVVNQTTLTINPGNSNQTTIYYMVDLSYMFNYATSFNQPINWNTENVTLTTNMFDHATSFNQSINWNLSNSTDLSYMFTYATSFNNGDVGDNNSCPLILQLPIGGQYDFCNIKYMFNNASSFNQDVSSWNAVTIDYSQSLFVNTKLNTRNYDKLLYYWSLYTLKPSMSFDWVKNLTYTDVGKFGRDSIIAQGKSFSGGDMYISPTITTGMNISIDYVGNIGTSYVIAYVINIVDANGQPILYSVELKSDIVICRSNPMTFKLNTNPNSGQMGLYVYDTSTLTISGNTLAEYSWDTDNYQYLPLTTCKVQYSTTPGNNYVLVDASGATIRSDIVAFESSPITFTILSTTVGENLVLNFCGYNINTNTVGNILNTYTFTAYEDTLILLYTIPEGTNNTIYLPISSSEYTIDWGDNTITSNDDDNCNEHTYTNSGPKIMSIACQNNSVLYYSEPEANENEHVEWLTGCLSFGSFGEVLWYIQFKNAINLVTVPTSLSPNIISLDHMFYGCTSFNQDISTWNTPNVEIMSYMFYGCTSFNQPLYWLNMQNVIDTSYMFAGCINLEGQNGLQPDPANLYIIHTEAIIIGMFDGAIKCNKNLTNIIDRLIEPISTTNTTCTLQDSKNWTSFGQYYQLFYIDGENGEIDMNRPISSPAQKDENGFFTFNDFTYDTQVALMNVTFPNSVYNGSVTIPAYVPELMVSRSRKLIFERNFITCNRDYVVMSNNSALNVGMTCVPGILTMDFATIRAGRYNCKLYAITRLARETKESKVLPLLLAEFYVNVTDPTVCFKEGTKILTNKGYVPIETLRKGTLIKTLHGYRPLDMMGKSRIEHAANPTRVADQLYKCSKATHPVFEDLVLTGNHAILVDEPQANKDRVDGKYKLHACLDKNAAVYEVPGVYTIYHLALVGNVYGIFANGMLVESCSKFVLTNTMTEVTTNFALSKIILNKK